MRAASESTPSGDSLRLAVLAALNIADELFRCQDVQQAGRGALAERTEALERARSTRRLPPSPEGTKITSGN